MLEQSIAEGALFYGTTRRRRVVPFDAELRSLTLAAIDGVRALMRTARTPMATYEARRCDACSLIDDCQPRALGRHASVRTWFEARLDED